MKKFKILFSFVIILSFQSLAFGQAGILNVGFDMDDTILYSRFTFEKAPKHENGSVDYGWVNSHDRDYSMIIPQMVELMHYFTIKGHNVYVITSRKEKNSGRVAEFLSDQLGIEFEVDKNLFFSPSERIDGKKYTTKHRVMSYLDLDIYYGDADTDIIASLKADVYPVRVIRHKSSILSYGDNYFGDVTRQKDLEHPYEMNDLEIFYKANVGMFGEAIYPIVWDGPGK